jgi:DNA-binding response OmpR family regulator
MSRRRVLVVEDDAAIRQGMVDVLDHEGYEVLEAADGRSGMGKALTAPIDLLLLDLVLPHKGGLEILAEVRASRPTLPVIVITAKGAEDDRVKGLKLGADDYVVKPFSIRELVARVEAVLRRSAERPLDVTTVPLDGGVVDLAAQQVRFDDGESADLSEREVELLRYLVVHAGRAVSRDEILERVWKLNPRAIVETRTIDMHVARLREKLREDPANPSLIRTVRGKGYMVPGGDT